MCLKPLFPLVLLLISATYGNCQQPGADAAADPPNVLFRDAEALLGEQQRIGNRLIALLDDPQQPIEVRLAAADLLGRMQYLPAVETLIRHIELQIPKYEGIRDNPTITRPLMGALGKFGDAAVPQIVDTYVKSRNTDVRYLLVRSLKESKSAPTAIRYASGLAAAKTETELDKQWARYLVEMLGGPPRKER
ncbi:HEAT repeat domain-containing protein [Blastopirellula marina]|uniref:HEAT repeat domain-containing protein n=1 Tax=Blastopirellula marina TaxID=124 RepID=A0A2S8F3C9_9BACT|nr:hypothetical protein [Blastopirellula marina]PQO26660.1 hypothetical protein C5Y98_30235 [Blastopirellula marina]PTL40971.1 hypothetical protein C5Y97_30250 [Blastopirellula marina]